jgi:hypothetical protein
MSGPRRSGRVTSAALLLAIMLAGSLGLWVGVPLAWLWIGGLVQVATGSLGAAVAVMMLGVIVSIVLAARGLGWLSEKHAHARERQGLEELGRVPLEGVMVVSATIALVAFVVWFFVFAGAEPFPFSSSE